MKKGNDTRSRHLYFIDQLHHAYVKPLSTNISHNLSEKPFLIALS